MSAKSSPDKERAPVNLRAMRRAILVIMACLPVLAQAQVPAGDPGSAITYTRAIAVPLNGVLLFDKATDAWTWTFGKEPGAKVLASDRESGTLQGTARVNYRSATLGLREETMGVINYHVVLSVRAGECRITISELVHTGNRNTSRGGIHMGPLAKGPDPVQRVKGTGGSNARRIYAEVKSTADARLQALLQAFEARLRANAEP
jgi:hypothetical protein